jgi:hypothetical protein
MDRALLESQLAEVDKSVEQHRRYVVKQRELVAQLEDKGMDAKWAREQLALFENACAAFTARRDQLLRQLAPAAD